jgi:hypothetical protein
MSIGIRPSDKCGCHANLVNAITSTLGIENAVAEETGSVDDLGVVLAERNGGMI